MTEIQAQWLTLAFIIAVTLAVIIYDATIIRYVGSSASISNVVCTGFRKFPVLFALFLIWIGVLCGHWFPVYTN